MAIRLALTDDHPIVLHGLERLFAGVDEFEVVACCRTGDAALDAIRTQAIDVLLLDLRMPGRTGLDVLRTIADEQLTVNTILLTAAADDEQIVDAVRLGAKGVVLKESAPDTLLECVRRVSAGEAWLDGDAVTRAVDRVAARDSAAREAGALLTPREVEIVRMIAQGLRNRVIGERLSISEGTVKIHLHNIYEKLGVDGRLALMLCAQEKGLV
jgi:DNA-binding NarL/FixJ family response regulator